jgi:glutamate formiminotransferase
MLECVVNVSEGRQRPTIDALAEAAGESLLDLHADADHDRSVFTLAGPSLDRSLRALARRTVELVDLSSNQGAHPRLGALDVVPFAPLGSDDNLGATNLGATNLGATNLGETNLVQAIADRDSFAAWASAELGLPCFLYGPERGLPEIRRRAFGQLQPDLGPPVPHPSAGAVCVGARPALVAYNLWLASGDIGQARRIATAIRGPHLRTLALALGGGRVQVSCNLVEPTVLGPAQAYDAVAALAQVTRAELIGLLPASVLGAIPPQRWAQLDLGEDRTIEARLAVRLAG